MKNCLVAQSGGPTAAINASLAGVIHAAMKSEKVDRVFGGRNGIWGILNEDFLDLTERFQNKEEDLELLKQTPSMFLGSCRHKLAGKDADAEIEKIFQIFKKHDIGYFFYIGGNDSMDTVHRLSAYAKENGSDVKIMGVPKTIDNDLMETDHTPGFGSAAKYIATTIREIACDTNIYPVTTVNIVEIMGRNAGWLTAAAALARSEDGCVAPHLIYLPEVAFEEETFIQDVKEKIKQYQRVVVAVSEGVKDARGNYISARSDKMDVFGHVQLNGTGKYLESLVAEHVGCKVRSIELNILQRCASHLASATDLEESFGLGAKAVEAALAGHTGEMSVIRRISDAPYEIEYGTASVDLVANFEKKVPRSWISEEGNDVKEEVLTYLRPLIQGEAETKYVNGLPQVLWK